MNIQIHPSKHSVDESVEAKARTDALSRTYPEEFQSSPEYRATLPDLQNGPSRLIRGKRVKIQHVGISNFRLPLLIKTRSGVERLETSVTGSVSLSGDAKGINMSRIMRSFYDHSEAQIGFDIVDAVIESYRRDLGSTDARLLLRFELPLQVKSLRSGLKGWQYYACGLEVVDQAGRRTCIMHLDYVYSSTCPCSLELSEHARRERGQLATPHSQRSAARVSVALRDGGQRTYFEDMIEACRAAVPTETQVMVKREDEQAFAELNAANPIFVEDAVRLFAEHLENLPGVGDYRVVASHQESLHSHDAVSVLAAGETFHGVGLEPRLFSTLVHGG